MALQDDVKEILIKNGKQTALELASVALFPALEAAVKASATPIDDVVLAALEQPLKDAFTKFVSGL